MENLVRNEQVITAAQEVEILAAKKDQTEDMIGFFSDFDVRFSKSRMPELMGKKVVTGKIEERLDILQEKIMRWDSDQLMTWAGDEEQAHEYLEAVEEVHKLTEDLGSSSLNGGQVENKILHRAQNILQVGMVRLEEEFGHILMHNKQLLEPEYVSCRSSEDETPYDESVSSTVDELGEDSQRKVHNGSNKDSEEYIISLMHPNSVLDLACIARVMCLSNYEQECCQCYSSIRRDVLEEHLFSLEIEKLSIEDILRMDWSNLNHMIQRWIRAMKIFIRVYLASEKHLCDQIFTGFVSVSKTCFTATSKGSLFQLLNFAEAIAIGPRLPEKLFRILDMYEGLGGLLPNIDALFVEEVGSYVRTECHQLLKRLGETVRRTFLEFADAVRTNPSVTPFAAGGIHHLTKYVMNYIRALMDYSETLNLLLEVCCEEGQLLVLSTSNLTHEGDQDRRTNDATPMARCIGSITSFLEANLDEKSKLYKDASLQHFFLMNNIYYMVQKVKSSELAALLKERWMREHTRKFQQHALNYERASWSCILSFLKEEGICAPGSSSVSKAVLKERFRSFNVAFEEMYKAQTGWLIPDPQLRDDLRISISVKLLQAYRNFVGRHASQLEKSRNYDKYIKYSEEDLQNYLLDFFEGSPKSLHHARRK